MEEGVKASFEPTLHCSLLCATAFALNYTCFRKFCISKFSSSELNIANSLYEALLVNNGDLIIYNFNRDEVDSIIVAMSTS